MGLADGLLVSLFALLIAAIIALAVTLFRIIERLARLEEAQRQRERAEPTDVAVVPEHEDERPPPTTEPPAAE